MAAPRPLAIRLARHRDAAVIALMSRDLIERGFGWTWRADRVTRHIDDPDSVAIAAGRGESVTGFALMTFAPESAHLNLLAVHPRRQRQRLGSRLLLWLERSARTAGVGTISLEVRERNNAGRRFYRWLGYREVGRVASYYGGREAATLMSKDLAALRPWRLDDGEALARIRPELCPPGWAPPAHDRTPRGAVDS